MLLVRLHRLVERRSVVYRVNKKRRIKTAGERDLLVELFLRLRVNFRDLAEIIRLELRCGVKVTLTLIDFLPSLMSLRELWLVQLLMVRGLKLLVGEVALDRLFLAVRILLADFVVTRVVFLRNLRGELIQIQNTLEVGPGDVIALCVDAVREIREDIIEHLFFFVREFIHVDRDRAVQLDLVEGLAELILGVAHLVRLPLQVLVVLRVLARLLLLLLAK